MTEANPGRFHRVDPAVVQDDPFWSVVRRRHPDVDVVLLPPDRAEELGQQAPLELVRASADAVVEAWRMLRPLVLAAGETGLPSVRWGSGGAGHALIIETAVRGIGQDDGTDLLRAAALTLGRAGWRLRPTTRDDLPALDATDGRTDLRAVAGPGATVLTIAGGVLPVEAAERDGVGADVREVLASWA